MAATKKPGIPFFSFHEMGVGGFLMQATPALMAAMANAIYWPSTSISETVLSWMPVSVDKLPAFTVMWIVTLWLVSIVLYVVGIVSCRPTGADNLHPRGMAKETSLGWIYRLHCAHDNTLEFLAIYVATVWAATNNGTSSSNSSLLIAKWSALIVVSRTVYPFCYVFNFDALRTSAFAVAFFACFVMGWTAVFPDMRISV